MEKPAIRERLVSHLPHIDAELAQRVTEGLGLKDSVKPAKPAREPLADLKPSKALSIIKNGPKTFAGRKVGILVTDGTDRQTFDALVEAIDDEKASFEVIAPAVGGATASDGSVIEAQQKIGGGPSVLYDSVAVIPSAEGAAALLKNASAKDFVSDAFAHLKFIAYSKAAQPLFEKIGIQPDEGFIALNNAKGAGEFISACRKLRLWERENNVTT